jgi:ribosomal protein S18 acetylase RimI-like enzyme
MHYRHYSPDDFAELYQIEELCFQVPFLFSRRTLRRMMENSPSVTWVAEDEGRLVGFAVVEFAERVDGKIAYIQTVEVLAQQRGHGVGGELLRRVEGSARAAGAGALWLHVDTQNIGAIRLYEAHGYSCVGRREDFYAKGRAGLIYRKLLERETAG